MKRWMLLGMCGTALGCSGRGDAPLDTDGDGIAADVDCNDANPLSYPGAVEICDADDNDCDGDIDEGLTVTYFLDADGDAFGDPAVSTAACDLPQGYVRNSLDCDDTNASIYPDALELCNAFDDDCDGDVDEGHDQDHDGFTSCSGDCDDDDKEVSPANEERCDGVDTDCDGKLGTKSLDESDADQDGFLACDGDCNDNESSIHPNAEEICDGIDNDCDGSKDENVQNLSCPDKDGDGYGDASDITSSCEEPPEENLALCTDCDDDSASINPSATERCNGLDDDCDGLIELEEQDLDQDGLAPCEGDCDDEAADVHPGGRELCDDGIDQDCDGSDLLCPEEDNDGDGYTDNEGDCNDADPEVYPGANDICGDGLDQDCDGEPEAEDGDDEPNDTLADAVDLGTLDSTTVTCTTVEGILQSPGDHDIYRFYSIDQAGNDWAISGELVVPDGVRYCIDMLDDDGTSLASAVCALGPASITNSIEFIPELATGYYYIDVYADEENACALYSLTACGY